MPESDLYAPVKAFLEARGYEVRGEVRGVDVLAVEPVTEGGWPRRVVAVELKANLCLDVLQQAMARMAGVDAVYVACGTPPGRRARAARDARAAADVRLCRMLGFGLLSVRDGRVSVLCEPEEYRSRPNVRYRLRLLAEFDGRTGDRNTGGTTRRPRVTAYRELALEIAYAVQACAEAEGQAEVRLSAVKARVASPRVAVLLRNDVYGWFRRPRAGVYALTTKGMAALEEWADVVEARAAAKRVEALC